MSFGDILDAWERQEQKKPKNAVMDKILNSYPPLEKDNHEKTESYGSDNAKILKRKYLLELAPQKQIDLHGNNGKKAIEMLAQFIRECKKENIKKILIIHGKGNHSTSGPVLQKIIIQYIQQCSLAGEYGFADRTQGGRGALWVILR